MVQLGINIYICSCLRVVNSKQSFYAASVIFAVQRDVSVCSSLYRNFWYLSFYLNGSDIIYLIFLYNVSTNIQVANYISETLLCYFCKIQTRCLDAQFQIVVLVCTIYIYRTDSRCLGISIYRHLRQMMNITFCCQTSSGIYGAKPQYFIWQFCDIVYCRQYVFLYMKTAYQNIMFVVL